MFVCLYIIARSKHWEKQPARPESCHSSQYKWLPIVPDELSLETHFLLSRYLHSWHWLSRCQKPVRQVLFALSHTSLNLRRFFLCYLWQRIEVSRARHASMKNRSLALELVRQLEIVTIRDSSLAKYVEYVMSLPVSELLISLYWNCQCPDRYLFATFSTCRASALPCAVSQITYCTRRGYPRHSCEGLQKIYLPKRPNSRSLVMP